MKVKTLFSFYLDYSCSLFQGVLYFMLSCAPSVSRGELQLCVSERFTRNIVLKVAKTERSETKKH